MTYRLDMGTTLLDAPQRLSARDLLPGQAVVLSVAALGFATALDAIDGQLGAPFAVSFILIAVTIPLALRIQSMVFAAVFPPLLMVVSLLLIATWWPGLIQIVGVSPSVGAVGLALAQLIEFGLVLAVGYALTLIAVVVRIATAPR